jgi:hypothetical protein
MHEDILAQAVIPVRYRILRLDLMPYSLGCELQLFRENSPFLLLSRDEFDDLTTQDQCLAVLRAVNICCRKIPKWNYFRVWKNNGCPIALLFGRKFYLCEPQNIVLAISEFRNYLNDGRVEFKADLPKDDDVPTHYVGAPEVLRLYQFVLEHVPREEIRLWGKTAWDFPFSFAKLLWQAHTENMGGLEIYNYKQMSHDNFVMNCEAGRAAWTESKTDDERRTALQKYPVIRELGGLEEEVALFEKGSPCPA